MQRVIMLTEARDFSKEINCLANKESISGKSPLLSLNPFLDEVLLRVGRRLVNSLLGLEAKHPVLLPRNHHVTTLIIRGEHLRLHYAEA